MAPKLSAHDDALTLCAMLSAAFDPEQDIGAVCVALLDAPDEIGGQLFRLLAVAVVELGDYIERHGDCVADYVARLRAAALQCQAEQ